MYIKHNCEGVSESEFYGYTIFTLRYKEHVYTMGDLL